MLCSSFQPLPVSAQLCCSSAASEIKRRTQLKVFNISSEMDSEEVTMKETFFISHGTPRMTVEESKPARHFFQRWREVHPKKPKSILIVSAHWETELPAVTAAVQSDLIYDFYGFPARFKSVHMDDKRGLDHGAWVPLMFMYPEADIPVCQLSVQSHLDGKYHFDMGRALAPLKEKGVLIIGSGSATHPSNATPHCNDGVAPWAAEFDEWLETALTNKRYEDVNNYDTKAPNWKTAHPSPEHFYPLHVAMGAAGENSRAELIHNSWDHGTMSYGSYKFTSG